MKSKAIRAISNGNFHNIHASNQAEKFKLMKLEQGIESCKNVQMKRLNHQKRDILSAMAQLTKDKSTTSDDDERFFLDCIPGDGMTLLSVSPISTNKGCSEVQDDENEKEEAVRRSLYYLELQDTALPIEGQGTTLGSTDDCENNKSQTTCCVHNKLMGNTVKSSAHDSTQSRRSSLRQTVLRESTSNKTDSMRTVPIGQQQRRSSLEQSEVMPFYLKKKFDRGQQSSTMLLNSQRLLPRRASVLLDNGRSLHGKQFMGSSADLGTVSFKSFTGGPFHMSSNEVIQEAIQKPSQSKMDFEHNMKPESDMERINLALEAISSGNYTSEMNPLEYKASKARRRNSVTVRTSKIFRASMGSNRKFSLAEKRPILDSRWRRNTIGSLHSANVVDGTQGSFNMLSNESSQEEDLARTKDGDSIATFNDKGVVFPAYKQTQPYTLTEFISLRKCRYLRLSKLNWKSLSLLSKHNDSTQCETLVDYSKV